MTIKRAFWLQRGVLVDLSYGGEATGWLSLQALADMSEA